MRKPPAQDDEGEQGHIAVIRKGGFEEEVDCVWDGDEQTNHRKELRGAVERGFVGVVQMAVGQGKREIREWRDDEDRRVHQMLFEETGKARAIMEQALARLLEHEKIEL